MNIYIRAFAIVNLLFGLIGILSPEIWYQYTPGASDTGPLNVHFVRDIGIAFVAAGVGLYLGVASTNLKSLSGPVVAMVFIGGHAILHTFEMVVHHFDLSVVLRDVVLIVLPAALAVFWLVKNIRTESKIE